uniref:Rho-GAP domain-containing protein n=1 Tax=Meloidogyne javanica TaxID=6303 RepID=A0A915N4S5_MELJA
MPNKKQRLFGRQLRGSMPPQPVLTMIDHLLLYGADAEGIFRKSPKQQTVRPRSALPKVVGFAAPSTRGSVEICPTTFEKAQNEEQTRMGISALAVCVAPSLLEKLEQVESVRIIPNLVIFLIEYAHELFDG